MKPAGKNIFFFLVALVIIAFFSRGLDTPDINTGTQTYGEETARVIEVIDGDTIRVQFPDGRIEKVRYIGINTPEMNRPGGSEAKLVNEQLVGGKTVTLVRDVSERDRYGRLLRYVYVGSVFVNAELVRLGYAQAATYPPDVKYADYFIELEREAREQGAGLWSSP